MTDRYDIGDRPTITATFRSLTDVLTNPTAITFKTRKPDGTVTTANQTDAANPSVGVWEYLLPAAFDRAGSWTVRVQATAGIETAGEFSFQVRASEFSS
jgi:predicted MarR family transcription regulator